WRAEGPAEIEGGGAPLPPIRRHLGDDFRYSGREAIADEEAPRTAGTGEEINVAPPSFRLRGQGGVDGRLARRDDCELKLIVAGSDPDNEVASQVRQAEGGSG